MSCSYGGVFNSYLPASLTVVRGDKGVVDMISGTNVRTMMEHDWDQLCEQAETMTVPPTWAAELPPYALPANTVGVPLQHLLRLVSNRDDQVAIGLVKLSQTGNQMAGRILVQAMLPKLSAISRRDINHDFADYVGIAWLRLMAFPVDKRSHAVLVNLTLDCLKWLSRQSARHRTEITLAALSDPQSDGLADDELPPWGAPTSLVNASERYVRALLELANNEHLVSSVCVDVLRSVYCDGLSGREAALRHHISHDMVRYYCSSAAKVLRSNRVHLIEELGPW